MAKSFSGITWSQGTWCWDLTNGPQGAAADAWFANMLSIYTAAVTTRGASSAVSAVLIRFTSAHLEWVQGNRSFDDLAYAINYVRNNMGKPVTLIWADVSFGNSASKYPSTAPWHTANGWRNTTGWTGQRSNLRIYNTAARAWAISALEDLCDWIKTGELAAGVPVIDWVHDLQICDETAPGNFDTDTQYTTAGYANAVLEIYQAVRAAWSDGPLSGALNFYPGGQQSALRSWMTSANMGRGMPDYNIFQTLKSLNRGVETAGTGDLNNLNNYGTHAWSKFTHHLASYRPSVQYPQWVDLDCDWNDALSKGIPGAQSSTDANTLSASRGGHPGGDNQLPWPDQMVTWCGFMRPAGLIVFDYQPFRAQLAQAMLELAPQMPMGPNPYLDGGSPPALLTAPYAVNCGGVAQSAAGFSFVSRAAPGSMSTKNVVGTIAGTDYQGLMSGMWRFTEQTTDGTLVLPFTTGTYDIIFPNFEAYWDVGVDGSPDGIERAFNIRIQGQLVIDTWSPFEDAGGRRIATQRRVNGVIVDSSELLTIRFERGPQDATYPDGKPEIACFLVLATGAPDPGIVAATVALSPEVPTNIQLSAKTSTSLSFTFGPIELAP